MKEGGVGLVKECWWCVLWLVSGGCFGFCWMASLCHSRQAMEAKQSDERVHPVKPFPPMHRHQRVHPAKAKALEQVCMTRCASFRACCRTSFRRESCMMHSCLDGLPLPSCTNQRIVMLLRRPLLVYESPEATFCIQCPSALFGLDDYFRAP